MATWPYNTAAWARLRAVHLSIEPLCRGCDAMGILKPANTVDHILAIKDGGPPFPGHDGLASYCGPCHGAKTARGSEAGAIRSTKPRRGCDADGNPLDPAHPWNEGVTDKGCRAGFEIKRFEQNDERSQAFRDGTGGFAWDGGPGAGLGERTCSGAERVKSLRADALGPTPALHTQLVGGGRPLQRAGAGSIDAMNQSQEATTVGEGIETCEAGAKNVSVVDNGDRCNSLVKRDHKKARSDGESSVLGGINHHPFRNGKRDRRNG